jgi:hypothetical protein
VARFDAQGQQDAGGARNPIGELAPCQSVVAERDGRPVAVEADRPGQGRAKGKHGRFLDAVPDRPLG